MARTLVEILGRYELYPLPILPVNRAGGSGAQGWGQLYAARGDVYHISTVSGSFIALPLQADVPWGPGDFTPVALLAADDLVLAVPGDSPIGTFEDFVERARETSPAIGGVGALSVDFMIVHHLGRLAGFEPRYVSFNAHGELAAAALSRSLDAVVTSPGEGMGLLASGDLRPILYVGPEAPDWLAHVPTAPELGYEEAMISMPRGVVLPPDVPDEVRQWWIEALRAAVETREWSDFLASNGLRPDLRFGDDFARYLEAVTGAFTEVFTELGVLEP